MMLAVVSCALEMPRPTRGEWIEIITTATTRRPTAPPRPTRGEWIEILRTASRRLRRTCLAPPGASGLKSCIPRYDYRDSGLAPPGASGLKSSGARAPAGLRQPRPTRGEWIEIFCTSNCPRIRSPRPTRGEWIEMSRRAYLSDTHAGLAPPGASGLKSSIRRVKYMHNSLAPPGASGLK